MKKTVAAVLLLFVCAFALCACTPGEKELKSKFIRNEYGIAQMTNMELSDRGADLDKVLYQFVARNNLSVAHVVAFKDSDSAKKCYDSVNAYAELSYDILHFVAKKRGNAVVWGTEDAVKLL